MPPTNWPSPPGKLFRDDEAGIISTLESKYGQPQVFSWEEENGQSMSWMKNGDFLIVSRIPDRFDKIDHQIVIYYTDRLKQLIDTERKEQEKKEQQRIKSGKKAF